MTALKIWGLVGVILGDAFPHREAGPPSLDCFHHLPRLHVRAYLLESISIYEGPGKGLDASRLTPFPGGRCLRFVPTYIQSVPKGFYEPLGCRSCDGLGRVLYQCLVFY